MFGCSALNKMKKRYKELKETKAIFAKKLEVLEQKYDSESWVGYNAGVVQRFAERYITCPECKEKKEIVEVCDALDAVIDEIDMLVENEYSREVFNVYSKKKPKLIRISTDEIFTWEDAFGDDFDKIEKGLRHSLVGLVEEPTRYKLK